jgi:secondary thiamine-phosphate synthase enzyme
VRHLSRRFTQGRDALGFERGAPAMLQLRRHLPHPRAEQFELRRATLHGTIRQRLAARDEFRPADQLLNRPAQVAAEVSGNPRPDQQEKRECDERTQAHGGRRTAEEEPGAVGHEHILAKGVFVRAQRRGFGGGERLGPGNGQGPNAGGGGAVPRGRGTAEGKHERARHPPRERQHHGRNECKEQQDDEQPSTEPELLHSPGDEWEWAKLEPHGFKPSNGERRGRQARHADKPTMKTHTSYLTFNTKRRQEIIDITDEVEACRAAADIREGMVLVSAMHISASVFVNDHESGLWQDILDWLERDIAPWEPDRYRHNAGTGEDNAAAHLRSLTIGHEVMVPVTDGKLDFGPWQRVFYGEWDGKRPKRVILKAMGI